MADLPLQELERSLRAAPEDAALRLRLAAALGRSGRRGEALGHLGLDRFPDEAFAEGRRLANELWQGELRSLERALAVPGTHDVSEIRMDPAGELVAWRTGARRLRIADLRKGEVLRVEVADLVGGLHVIRGRVFWDREGELASVAPGEDPVRVAPGGRVRLLDVAPSGDRVLVQDERREGVYEWPSMRPLVERPCRMFPPAVDWESGSVFVQGHGARVDVVALDGRPLGALELGGRGVPAPLGRGVVAQLSPSLALHGVRGRWSLPLVEVKRGGRSGHARPSLSSDGRGVRLLLADVPVRFEVDLERGVLREPPGHAKHLERSSTRSDGIWHPHADVVAQWRSPFWQLCELGGAPILHLPANAYPVAWTADGRGLLVNRYAGGENRVFVELWRARESGGS